MSKVLIGVVLAVVVAAGGYRLYVAGGGSTLAAATHEILPAPDGSSRAADAEIDKLARHYGYRK